MDKSLDGQTEINIKGLAEKLNASILTGDTGLGRDIGGIYTCDLLSWVISHTQKGDAWITVHTNLNIVAVALLAEVSCIIIPEGIRVDAATVERAVREGIPLLSTKYNAYQVCCIAYESGLKPGKPI